VEYSRKKSVAKAKSEMAQVYARLTEAKRKTQIFARAAPARGTARTECGLDNGEDLAIKRFFLKSYYHFI
jgi:hypothetical protein